MINNYPPTDFHEINLDYLLKKYFDIDTELKSQIAGLAFDSANNMLVLKDKDNNVLSTITIPYATSAGNAENAANASNAGNANKALKDMNNNDLTSYVKNGDIVNNVISLRDGDNNVVASLPVSALEDKFTITAYVTENTAHRIDDDDLVANNHCRYYMPDITSYDEFQTWQAALEAALSSGTPIIIYLYSSPDATRYLNRIVWDDTILIDCDTFINSFTLGSSWDATKGAAVDFLFKGNITYA